MRFGIRYSSPKREFTLGDPDSFQKEKEREALIERLRARLEPLDTDAHYASSPEERKRITSLADDLREAIEALEER